MADCGHALCLPYESCRFAPRVRTQAERDADGNTWRPQAELLAQVTRWRVVLQPHRVTVKGIAEQDARALADRIGGAVDRSTVRVYADGTEVLGPWTEDRRRDVEEAVVSDERVEVHKYAITVPIATGRCENCGQPVAYNLAVPICQHTEPTDCTDPFPAIEEKP